VKLADQNRMFFLAQNILARIRTRMIVCFNPRLLFFRPILKKKTIKYIFHSYPAA
jgi:hypothetical protein